jgi:hypothetical protein
LAHQRTNPPSLVGRVPSRGVRPVFPSTPGPRPFFMLHHYHDRARL